MLIKSLITPGPAARGYVWIWSTEESSKYFEPFFHGCSAHATVCSNRIRQQHGEHLGQSKTFCPHLHIDVNVCLGLTTFLLFIFISSSFRQPLNILTLSQMDRPRIVQEDSIAGGRSVHDEPGMLPKWWFLFGGKKTGMGSFLGGHW